MFGIGLIDGAQNRARILLLTIALLFSASVVLVLHRWYDERDELVIELRTLANIVGANATASLVFNDQQSGAEILSALNKAPLVRAAAIYKADHQILATYSSPGQATKNFVGPAPVAGTHFTWQEIMVVVPVMLETRDIGKIVIRGTQERVLQEVTRLISLLLTLSLTAGALGFAATYKLRRRMALARSQLEASRTLLQQFVINRETLLDDEHRRIAIEIHDQLGQVLTTALLNLRLLERGTARADEKAIHLIKEIEGQLDEAYRGMKDIAASLHPVVIQFGLVASIEWLAERVFKNTEVEFKCAFPDQPLELDPRQAMALFRITQEVFANAVRHANAASVHLFLTVENGKLALEIFDSGIGFDIKKVDSALHFGLVGIRQRAESIGGEVEISSSVGGGTLIRVSIEYGKSPPAIFGAHQ